MVPPGSWEILSDPSNAPPQGYGESTLGEVARSEPVRLPDLSTVFGRRAERLKALAEGHELRGFLLMISAIVAAQESALSALPPGSLPGAVEVAKAKLVGRAPLDPELWKRDGSWRAALSHILAGVDRTVLPAPATEACEALQRASEADHETLADRYLQGTVPTGEAGKAVFVAAALQVAWTRMAALLDAADLGGANGDQGTCPACGSPPVAGIVSPGGTKFGHRHLHCSLCATSWRYVRVRCVHCGSTEKISFRNLAGTTYLRAECCESCQGYSKVFYLESMKALEALADDLGSLGLDVLVGEEGFARAPNPFVLGVTTEQPES